MLLSSNPSWPPPEPRQDLRRAFLARVALALHVHGTPAYGLEELVARVSKALGVRSRVLATPTSVQLAIDTPEGGTSTELLRGRVRDPDLGKLAELDRVILQVERGEMSPGEGVWAIDAIQARPSGQGAPYAALAGAAASGTGAVFFQGSALDVAVSALFGASLVALARVTARREEASRVHEPLAAFLVSVGASLLAATTTRLSPEVVVLAALISLIPGLAVTTAVSELASGHVVSGTSRLAGGATLFVSLVFGVALGQAVAAHLAPVTAPRSTELLPMWVQTLAILIAPAAFAALFHVARRDVLLVCAAGLVAFGAARMGANALGPELGGFAGATALGLVSNLYARTLDRPATVLRLPGLLLLVPGSIGFRSLSSFLAEDPLAGTAGVFRVGLMAMALVSGLFTANLLLSARRSI